MLTRRVSPGVAARFLASLAFVAILIWVCFSLLHVNATTVALSMLLLVLAVATRWGLPEAVFTSIVCMLGFNFFFLPPIKTFTIADPQDWIALLAFLITAVVGSQLSAKAKKRAEEASARRSEIERLYSLSRAMLMDDATEITKTALVPIQQIFDLAHVAFFDADSGEFFGSEQPAFAPPQLASVATTEEAVIEPSLAILPVRMGTRVIGSVALAGKDLTAPERDSIANLVGIGYERARALERAATAEAARQGERLKTFVLDGIAHDLKTPLTAIKTCVSTLITIPPRTEEKRAELLNIIDEETEHLSNTITQAIQLARIEAHKVIVERQRVSVAELVHRVLSHFADAPRFVPNVPADLVLKADPELLAQAIRQLLENARKYSPRGAPIEVSAAREGSDIVMRVMDKGPGISPIELERIFDKFFRGTRGRSTAEGTGMGLAIAKGIIEAHGGHISAENRPGGGAVFLFQLPAA